MSAEPTSPALEKLAERVARETARLARLKARQLAKEMEAKHLAREAERRAKTRRQQELVRLAAFAGADDFTPVEVLGLLLDGVERAGQSPTMRLAARKRGEERVRAAIGLPTTLPPPP